jgi:antitoxin FitA
MPAITVPDVDDATLAHLEARARQHGRTVEEEVRAILKDVATPPDPVWNEINQLRESIAASGRVFTDSVQLLREDRER